MINTIFNEDCFEGMKRIPDKSIDMILCDLPYGTTYNKWDDVLDIDLLWRDYKRVIKDNGAIALFAQSPFDKILGCSNLKMLRYEIIWKKINPTGFLNAKKMPLKSHENILIFYNKLPTFNPQFTKGKGYNVCSNTKSSNYGEYENVRTINKGQYYPISIVEFGRDRDRLHPTQKPVALFEYLIKTYTNENEIILDNCIGSGTTAIAAINTNRNYIGFELDKNYYEIALKRIHEFTKADDVRKQPRINIRITCN